MSWVRTASWATLALALAHSEARAQPAPRPTPTPFTLEVGVNLVSVTVVVYDKAGRFVQDLGPQDIEVRENGVPQEVSFFQAASGEEKIPLSVMLVLDASGSMKENLGFLQEAALAFVYKLEDVDIAQVVQFNESIKGSAEFTGDIDRLERFIDGLQAWGGTSLYDAIHYGLNRIRDQPGRKALVVFSDGEDTTSTFQEKEVIDYARAVEATIYTVGIKAGRGFAGRTPRGFLKKIARETGGDFFFPKKIGELVKVFSKISDELHNHYLLAYAPKVPPDGTWREIDVELDRKDAELRVRKGYFAVRR
jgi:Ca-activated chloride channel family protein